MCKEEVRDAAADMEACVLFDGCCRRLEIRPKLRISENFSGRKQHKVFRSKKILFPKNWVFPKKSLNILQHSETPVVKRPNGETQGILFKHARAREREMMMMSFICSCRNKK